MKGLIILVDGFEDVEALATIDVLRRALIQLDMVSLDKKEITTQSKNIIKVPYLINEIDCKTYDFLIIPGGKAVFNILDKDSRIDGIITNFYINNKLICAICAAPRLLAKHGYFKNNKYTSFPECVDEQYLETRIEDGVVISGTLITAKSMYYSIDFALAIIEKLCGKELKEKVLKQIKGEM